MILFSSLNKMFAKILFWKGISKQREQLSSMNDYLLNDIGFSRVDADREAHRMFWDYSPTVDKSL